MHPSPSAARTDAPPASRLASLLGACVTVTLALLALLQEPRGTPARGAAAGAGGLPPLRPCVPERPGLLRGRIFGDLRLDVDWQGAALSCEGGPRPGGAGVRLFFAGRPDGDARRLVLVLGIDAPPGALARGERGTSVTLMDERGGHFYHAEPDRCWTQVSEQAPLAGGGYRVAGTLYCAGAIPAVNAPGAVTLGDFAFIGRVGPDAP